MNKPTSIKSLKLQIIVLIILLTPALVQGQELFQYFDGQDTIPEFSIIVNIDSMANNVWQVGPPFKNLFNQASTVPNVIITDTIQPYPINDSSSFSLDLDFSEDWGWGILQINWNQKLDLDSAKDFGFLEYTVDGGEVWSNVYDDPYVYSYYGFNEENMQENEAEEHGFSGTDIAWKNVWLCYDASWLYEVDSITFRFRLDSDSIHTAQEGWMIDDMMLYNGVIHTVNEVTQDNYMDVSPNPTSERVNINAQKVDGYHIIENMELIDSKGRVVRKFKKVPTKFHFDISNHPAGTYMLKIETNKSTEVFRLVILRE